jgi:hypothetical protein
MPVLSNGAHMIVTQTVGVPGIVFIGDEQFPLTVKLKESPFPGTDPEYTRSVLQERSDDIVARTSGSIRLQVEYLEVITIVAVQPVLGAKPQKSPAVLEDAVYCTLGESLLDVEVFKPDLARLGRSILPEKEYDEDTECRLYPFNVFLPGSF